MSEQCQFASDSGACGSSYLPRLRCQVRHTERREGMKRGIASLSLMERL